MPTRIRPQAIDQGHGVFQMPRMQTGTVVVYEDDILVGVTSELRFSGSVSVEDRGSYVEVEGIGQAALAFRDEGVVQGTGTALNVVGGLTDITISGSVGHIRRRFFGVNVSVSGSSQNTPHNTGVAVVFGEETYDHGDYFNGTTGSNRITIPSGLDGFYRFGGHVEWAANATGIRQARLVVIVGGIPTIVAAQTIGANAAVVRSLSLQSDYELSAGASIQLHVLQTSGGNLAINNSQEYSVELWAEYRGRRA